MHSFGIHNDTKQDTTPGSGCLLSPPEGFSGSEREYLDYLRDASRHPSFRQRLWLLANRWSKQLRADPVELDGPYADAAKRALKKAGEWTKGSAA